ncbi:MAG: FIST N-terminal domain-containing protein [Brevinematia bacterium]
MKYLSIDNIEMTFGAKWSLAYTTVDVDIKDIVNRVKKIDPRVEVFGCSSFQGVFTPYGFMRGTHFLASYSEDGIEAVPVVYNCSPTNAKAETLKASKEIFDKIGTPDVVLMHAVPGFEEKIVEGVDEFFQGQTRIYGGSAADDNISGKWFVFHNDKVTNEGVLLIGFKSPRKIYGAFLSGYLPTTKKGIVTKAEGRTIYEIDGKPAAMVYNEWLDGAISEYLEKGGVILAQTTLKPIGRIIGEIMGIKNYLLSHPHSVIPENKAMTLFTEFKEGDEIILMTGYRSALIDRAKQVVERALGMDKDRVTPLGAILIYCGGCVGAIIEDIQQVVESYKSILGKAPFIGAATFGEQGCFLLKENQRANKHGNLMADNIIFG